MGFLMLNYFINWHPLMINVVLIPVNIILKALASVILQLSLLKFIVTTVIENHLIQIIPLHLNDLLNFIMFAYLLKAFLLTLLIHLIHLIKATVTIIAVTIADVITVKYFQEFH